MIGSCITEFIINMILFFFMIWIAKHIIDEKQKGYLPPAWIGFDSKNIKLFLLGALIAIFLESLIGVIGTLNGTILFEVNKSGIKDSLILSFARGFGFLGVALFEEGLFRGYLMQVILKKHSKIYALCIQALIFGALHYFNYSKLPHKWMSLINVTLLGLIYGIIVIKTNSLMFVIGSHLTFNICCELLFIEDFTNYTRFICFKESKSLVANFLSSLFYPEFIELMILFIIAITLIFLFKKDIFLSKSNSNLNAMH